MPQDFLPILVLFLMAVGLGILVLIIARLFGPRVPTRAKMMPY